MAIPPFNNSQYFNPSYSWIFTNAMRVELPSSSSQSTPTVNPPVLPFPNQMPYPQNFPYPPVFASPISMATDPIDILAQKLLGGFRGGDDRQHFLNYIEANKSFFAQFTFLNNWFDVIKGNLHTNFTGFKIGELQIDIRPGSVFYNPTGIPPSSKVFEMLFQVTQLANNPKLWRLYLKLNGPNLDLNFGDSRLILPLNWLYCARKENHPEVKTLLGNPLHSFAEYKSEAITTILRPYFLLDNISAYNTTIEDMGMLFKMKCQSVEYGGMREITTQKDYLVIYSILEKYLHSLKGRAYPKVSILDAPLNVSKVFGVGDFLNINQYVHYTQKALVFSPGIIPIIDIVSYLQSLTLSECKNKEEIKLDESFFKLSLGTRNIIPTYKLTSKEVLLLERMFVGFLYLAKSNSDPTQFVMLLSKLGSRERIERLLDHPVILEGKNISFAFLSLPENTRRYTGTFRLIVNKYFKKSFPWDQFFQNLNSTPPLVTVSSHVPIKPHAPLPAPHGYGVINSAFANTHNTPVPTNTAAIPSQAREITIPPAYFQKLLEEVFIKNKEKWIHLLEQSQGCWLFKDNYNGFYEAIFDYFNTFKETQPNHNVAEAAIKKLLALFPPIEIQEQFFTLIGYSNSNLQMSVIPGIENPHKDPATDQIIPLSDFLIQKICPTVFQIKLMEFKAHLQNNNPVTTTSGTTRIPCLFIREEGIHFRAYLLNAVFENDKLTGISKDHQQKGEIYFKLNKLLEKFEDVEGERECLFTLEKLDGLKSFLSNSTTNIPPFLLLDLITPSQSQTLPQPFAASDPSGRKRSLESADESLVPPKKRAKHNPIPALMNTTNALKPVQLSESIETGFSALGNSLPLDPNQFWRNLSLNNAMKLCAKSTSKIVQRNLFLEEPHHYPILKLLEQGDELTAFKPIHPLLKAYQTNEVKTQLCLLKKGISRLLSFEMGLGKTFVIAEILSQLILQGREGTFFVVVPKSITLQMKKELEKYLSQVVSVAWNHQFTLAKEDTKSNIIVADMKKMIRSIKRNNPDTFFSLIPLLSYANIKQTYNLWVSKGVLEENKIEFWNEIKTTATKLMDAIDPPVLKELKRQVLQSPAQYFLSEEKGASDIWIKECKNNSTLPFSIGQKIKSVSFNPPLLFAQLVCVSKLIRYYYRKNAFQNPELTTYPNALKPLSSFSLNDIIIAANPDEIKNSLSEKTSLVVTHYEAFGGLSEDSIKDKSIGAIVFDEAQKIHTSKSKKTQKLLQLTLAAKKQDPKLPLLLSTATPFENNFAELWTLLQLANPLDISFDKTTFQSLKKRLQKLHKALSTEILKKQESLPQNLLKYMIQTFSHMEAFRRKILVPLLARKEKNDADVQACWSQGVPERKNIPIVATISPETKTALEIAHNQYLQSSNNLEHLHKIKRILLHPTFRECSLVEKNEIIDAAENLLQVGSMEQKQAWIMSSPLLSNLFTSNPFQEMIQNSDHALVFTEHLKTAYLIQLAAESYFSKNKIEARQYTGDQSIQERDDNLSWFKSKGHCAKLLVIMKKAGSIGLNVPEASYVFIPDDDWNPSNDRQAAARALRVNSTGIKTIVTFSYDTFLHHHTQAVREVKESMEKFFHIDTTKSVRQQFNAFKNVVALQYYQTQLNITKDKEKALELKNKAIKLLESLGNEIDDETLSASLQSVTPSTN